MTTPNPRSVQPDPGSVRAEHRNAGYSFDGDHYVARCDCGWRTTPRTTYDRAQAAIQAHLAGPARVAPDQLSASDRDALVAGFDRMLDPDAHGQAPS